MLPVIEHIARNVLDTVASVRESNGYNFNLTAQRHSKTGDKREHLNAIILQDDPRPPHDPKGYNTLEWFLTFGVGVFIMPPEGDITPIDTYVNIIRSDVEKALMIDRYRNQHALDTRILAAHVQIEEGSEYDLVVINAEVNYRTTEVDPYVIAP